MIIFVNDLIILITFQKFKLRYIIYINNVIQINLTTVYQHACLCIISARDERDRQKRLKTLYILPIPSNRKRNQANPSAQRLSSPVQNSLLRKVPLSFVVQCMAQMSVSNSKCRGERLLHKFLAPTIGSSTFFLKQYQPKPENTSVSFQEPSIILGACSQKKERH